MSYRATSTCNILNPVLHYVTKLKVKVSCNLKQIQIHVYQSQQAKCRVVNVIKDATTYICSPTMLQHFSVINALISRHQILSRLFLHKKYTKNEKQMVEE